MARSVCMSNAIGPAPLTASVGRRLTRDNMVTPERVCEVCHGRPATNYVCEPHLGRSRDLCDECFQASAPLELRESAAAVRAAHCQYCGAQPCAGGTDFLAQSIGVQRTKYMCMPCTQEYLRYTQGQMQHLPAASPQQEQLAAIRRLLDAADTHMKIWVSERK